MIHLAMESAVSAENASRLQQTLGKPCGFSTATTATTTTGYSWCPPKRGRSEQARKGFADRLSGSPEHASNNSLMGVALAYLGRREEALAYGREGARLYGPATQMDYPYNELQLVRIDILLGDHDSALNVLEPLMQELAYLTPGWLTIDPMFDPLRDHPRFQALLEEYDER
jgi:tetratricopeptide (TPR) repeat protein